MNLPPFLEAELNTKAIMFFRALKRKCKVCSGKGHLVGENSQFTDCPGCTLKFYEMRKYLDANISTDYLNIKVADLEKVFTTDCFAAYRGLIKNLDEILRSFNIFFYRNNDEHSYGVTTAGALLIRKAIDIGQDAAIVDLNALFDCFFTFQDDKDTNTRRDQLYAYYSQVPILMVDGFASEMTKSKDSYAYGRFYTFLNSRKITNRSTIICSDLTEDEVYQKYSKPIVAIIKQSYLPFSIACMEGKNRQHAITKFRKDFPEIAQHLSRKKEEQTITVKAPAKTTTTAVKPKEKDPTDDLDRVSFEPGDDNGKCKNRKY